VRPTVTVVFVPSRPRKSELADHASAILRHLKKDYPIAVCELTHETPFQLLAATILSAQCTDARVNMVTPHLFRCYPDAESLAVADVRDVEEIVRSTGFFGTKARNLIGMANAVVNTFAGKVPTDMDDLVTLPGVGRKTANVVRSVAFDLPGLPVDTHVGRLSRRLGLTRNDDPVKVESDLCALLPPKEWGEFSLRLILHGRRICDARAPRCGECRLAEVCPSASVSATSGKAMSGAAKSGAAKPGKTKSGQAKSQSKSQSKAVAPTARTAVKRRKASPKKAASRPARRVR
jgi:endonuclease-3